MRFCSLEPNPFREGTGPKLRLNFRILLLGAFLSELEGITQLPSVLLGLPMWPACCFCCEGDAREQQCRMGLQAPPAGCR